MVNVKELKAEMTRNGYTQERLAAEMGISSRTLCSKLKKGVFGTDEVEKIVKILKIKNPVPIFLAKG